MYYMYKHTYTRLNASDYWTMKRQTQTVIMRRLLLTSSHIVIDKCSNCDSPILFKTVLVNVLRKSLLKSTCNERLEVGIIRVVTKVIFNLRLRSSTTARRHWRRLDVVIIEPDVIVTVAKCTRLQRIIKTERLTLIISLHKLHNTTKMPSLTLFTTPTIPFSWRVS